MHMYNHVLQGDIIITIILSTTKKYIRKLKYLAHETVHVWVWYIFAYIIVGFFPHYAYIVLLLSLVASIHETIKKK